MGHEAAGIVESVGEGVTNVQVGDHVSRASRCFPRTSKRTTALDAGTANKTNLCGKIRPYTGAGVMAADQTRLKPRTAHPLVHGASFSQYTVLHKRRKIRKDAPLEKVNLLGCGLATGWGAVANAQVEENSICAVFGLGAVGLSVIEGCKNAGAKQVIAVDIDPGKYERAKEFGATDCVNPDFDKPIQEVLVDMTGGGVDALSNASVTST